MGGGVEGEKEQIVRWEAERERGGERERESKWWGGGEQTMRAAGKGGG